MRDWDAIVVGAGPAGSTAARELAASGARVLLTDRAAFPRYKACGGGIALRTERLLEFAIAPVVETSVSMVQLRHSGRCVVSKDAGMPFARMVMRDRFDALLVEQAEVAGAEFRPGTLVRSVDERGDRVRVIADGFVAEAECVIGADGANSTVGRGSGLGDVYACPAWELEVRVPPRVAASFRECCVLGLGYRPWGYAWVFPKADSLSIGMVLPSANGSTLKAATSGFVSELAIPEAEILVARGHKVRSRRGRESIATARVALVGGAAGLADEFTQEGIYYAIRSGQLAAEAASRMLQGRCDLKSYESAVDEEVMPELRAARLIGYMFYGMLRRTGRGWLAASSRAGFLWESFFAAQRGDSSYARELARLPWLEGIAAARVDRR